MGISRDSQHKRRLTGGKKPQYHKKRKYDGAKNDSREEMQRCNAKITRLRSKRYHNGRRI